MIAVVAEINYLDGVLTQKQVEVADGSTWKDAYLKFLSEKHPDKDFWEWVKELPDDIAEAKQELIDGEMDISVVFIAMDRGNNND